MNLSSASPVVNLDSYEENGEWEIYRTDAKRKVRNSSLKGSKPALS